MASIAAIAINDDKCPKGTVPDTSAPQVKQLSTKTWRLRKVEI